MLPFEDNYFDSVLMTEVLEHVASPESVFQEISRVLKPGGTLYLTTPSAPICRFWRMVFWPAQQVKRLFVPQRTNPEDQVYDVPLSKSEIIGHINGAGLELSEYFKSIFLPHESYLQFFPKPILHTLLLSAKFIEAIGPLGMFMGLHHIMIVNKP